MIVMAMSSKGISMRLKTYWTTFKRTNLSMPSIKSVPFWVFK